MILEAFKLDGKAAVVTGAGRGIGRGLALGLAEAGADVVVVSRSDSAERTAGEIGKLGRKAVAVRADVAKPEAVSAVMDAAIRAFGRVDILVNNAGTVRRAPVLDFTAKDWDDVVDLNLKAAFFLAQAAARDMMKRKKGKIINIASVISFSGGVNIPSYAASKGGLKQVTMALANELSPHGINVNAIAPGYIATDINRDLREDKSRYRELTSRIPAGRWGTPEDLQGAAVYLASDASNYCDGSVVVVDGGWCAR